MVAGLAYKEYFKKQHILKKKNNCINKKQQHTYLIRLTDQTSDLISRGKYCRLNNTEIDSPPNHAL